MAFSQVQEEVNLSHGGCRDKSEQVVTSCLYLKSSSSSSSQTSEPLDKHVVLRRIRHHKRLNNIKSTFQALLSTSEHKWLEHEHNDAFSAP
ncbi:hypothetical protein Acr_09g0003510 [Actinidia rufa]|uniref:Uncharacterized protein n=1 Tax=Actinidia rufa TaxID=165716 RepID=A0A7J0F5C0_9ERIC|nr:hypothetical protein Acr_09g0003510 [Actinidia rufa]